MRISSVLRRVALVPSLAAGLLAVSLLPGAGAPELRADSCLTGRWQSTDIETYMRSVLSSPGFTVVSVSGTQSYVFGEDGTFINTVDDVVVRQAVGRGVGVEPSPMALELLDLLAGGCPENPIVILGDVADRPTLDQDLLPTSRHRPGISDGGWSGVRRPRPSISRITSASTWPRRGTRRSPPPTTA